MKRLPLAALCLLAVVRLGQGQAPAPAPNNTVTALPVTKASNLHQQSFDIVWNTVQKRHYDPQFGGVNWEQVRASYVPRLIEVKSDAELYRLLQQMLGELRQSHFNIIPPEAVLPDEAKETPTGSLGIDLRMIDDVAVITRVEANSAAASVGLRPGFVVKQVGAQAVAQLIAPVAKLDESSARKDLRRARRVLAALSGAPGSIITMTYLDEQNRAQTVSLTRRKLPGELAPRVGNFPPQYTEFEARRLPNGQSSWGYLRFNIFTPPVMEKIKTTLREFRDTDGLVFDLRGNPGGLGAMASGIAGLLSDKSGSLGTMKMRTNELKFAVTPQADPYLKPVAILIDGMSASTSEVFAAGMQELGRAVVVGERSAGACLPSVFEKLPTGALFQFAVADFRTPRGVLVEGRGVQPDVAVKQQRQALLAGRDAQLEAALIQLTRLRQPARGVK